MYNIVFINITKNPYAGVVTWSSFQDKKAFDSWYNDKMQSWYQVVEEGVSEERAIELCSSPEATEAAIRAIVREGAEADSHSFGVNP